MWVCDLGANLSLSIAIVIVSVSNSGVSVIPFSPFNISVSTLISAVTVLSPTKILPNP